MKVTIEQPQPVPADVVIRLTREEAVKFRSLDSMFDAAGDMLEDVAFLTVAEARQFLYSLDRMLNGAGVQYTKTRE